jgi:transcriptional regulator with XRE-family HTH domain
MVDISGTSPRIRDRDVFYYRQRNKNRLFEKLVTFFATEAEHAGVTKKDIAERLGRDPSQITRWLSAPNNLTPDSISDLLLALGAEMDYEVTKFSARARPNYEHQLITRCEQVATSASRDQQTTAIEVINDGSVLAQKESAVPPSTVDLINVRELELAN